MSDFNSKQKRETRKVELVETNNLALSLSRLGAIKPWSRQHWKLALYHALLMSEVPSSDMVQKIRVALELP